MILEGGQSLDDSIHLYKELSIKVCWFLEQGDFCANSYKPRDLSVKYEYYYANREETAARPIRIRRRRAQTRDIGRLPVSGEKRGSDPRS